MQNERLNNGNVDAFIQLGIDCKVYVSQSFTPPACNTRFAPRENASTLINEVRIYPNPASEKLTIEVGELTGGEIQMLNTMGQIVYQGKLNANNRQQINLATYGQGLFIVRIIGDGAAIEEKIILR